MTRTGALGAALVLAAVAVSSPAVAQLYSQGAYGNHCVALTFDDGPDPVETLALLALLEREHVAATFFMIGEHVAAYPQIAAQVAAAGFEIGNHTWDHPVLPHLTEAEISTEFARADAAIYAATGSVPTLVRPPKGAYSPDVLEAAGRPAILWSIATLDWMHHSVSFAVNRALSHAEDGMIVLMHDIQPIVVGEAQGIIDGLRARGYGFSTVSDLLAGAPCQ